MVTVDYSSWHCIKMVHQAKKAGPHVVHTCVLTVDLSGHTSNAQVIGTPSRAHIIHLAHNYEACFGRTVLLC